MGIDMKNHNLNAMPDAEKNHTPVPLCVKIRKPEFQCRRMSPGALCASSLLPSILLLQLVH